MPVANFMTVANSEEHKMIRSRLGLKALGMCAMVLGLMAVWAGAAQAEETGGKWTYLIPGKPETPENLKTFEGALAEPTASAKSETVSILHTKVLGGTSLLYECKAVTVIEGRLKGTTGEVLGKLKFTECETFLAGVLSKNCNPPGGVIETNKILVLMLLHLLGGVKDKVFVAHPDTGEANFAVVKSTEACSIGENVPIGGLWAFIDCKGDPSTHLVIHLIEEFPALNKLFVISDTAEHKATILGSWEVFLTGAHLNYKWAGLWN